jgi:phage baseplate assembly protein gpV
VNQRGNELGAIIDLIAEKVRFLKWYPGQVLSRDDPESRGRVRCAVPGLGWLKEDESPWCEPTYRAGGQVTPARGRYVVVGFLGGDPSRPIYLGEAGEVPSQRPTPYGSPDDEVLYSDGERLIAYDAATDSLKVEGFGSVEINGGSKRFVTHAELDAALQALMSLLNSHTHVVASIGAPTGPASASVPPVTFSVDISAAKTQTVKTGG